MFQKEKNYNYYEYFVKMAGLAQKASGYLKTALAEFDPEEIEEIRARWERSQTTLAMLCDHSSLSAIREEFRVLDPAGENFRETCLRLAAKLLVGCRTNFNNLCFFCKICGKEKGARETPLRSDGTCNEENDKSVVIAYYNFKNTTKF